MGIILGVDNLKVSISTCHMCAMPSLFIHPIRIAVVLDDLMTQHNKWGEGGGGVIVE